VKIIRANGLTAIPTHIDTWPFKELFFRFLC